MDVDPHTDTDTESHTVTASDTDVDPDTNNGTHTDTDIEKRSQLRVQRFSFTIQLVELINHSLAISLTTIPSFLQTLCISY